MPSRQYFTLSFDYVDNGHTYTHTANWLKSAQDAADALNRYIDVHPHVVKTLCNVRMNPEHLGNYCTVCDTM